MTRLVCLPRWRRSVIHLDRTARPRCVIATWGFIRDVCFRRSTLAPVVFFFASSLFSNAGQSLFAIICWLVKLFFLFFFSNIKGLSSKRKYSNEFRSIGLFDSLEICSRENINLHNRRLNRTNPAISRAISSWFLQLRYLRFCVNYMLPNDNTMFHERLI